MRDGMPSFLLFFFSLGQSPVIYNVPVELVFILILRELGSFGPFICAYSRVIPICVLRALLYGGPNMSSLRDIRQIKNRE